MKKIFLIVLSVIIVISGFGSMLAAKELEAEGNSVTLNVSVSEQCQKLISLNEECYSMENIEYTVFTDDGKDSEVAVFILDKYGNAYNKETGLAFADKLPDGDYYIEMTKSNDIYPLDNREYPFTVKSNKHLPESVSVTTVSAMYGKTSFNTYFSNNQYKLWTVDYGTGVFECGIAEVSAPEEIVAYGSHNISTLTSKVLDKESNELIYKIMYYGRSGPKQWDGFTSGKYKVPFTTRDGANYYKTSDCEALAAFVTHVCLARAYGANDKWNLQWSQDGVNDFWEYVNKAENAPNDFVVYVWENFKKNGTQDMFYGFLLQKTDYQKADISIEIAPAFDPIALLLTKKGSSDEKIDGARFEMRYYKDKINSVEEEKNLTPIRSWEFVTDENGRMSYSELSKVAGDELFMDLESGNNVLVAGSYVVEETYAPKGYVKAEPFFIQVSSNINETPVYFNKDGNRLITNDIDGYNLLELKEGFAKVNKIAKVNNEQSLENAKYGIYLDENCLSLAKDNDGNEAVLVTNKYGNTNIIALAPGVYFVKEIAAPEGFKIDEKVYVVEVKEQETAIVESVEDCYEVTVKITKKNKANGLTVSQAVYGIFKSDKLVEELVTDENGMASVTLPYAKQGYDVREIRAPEFYQIDERVYHIDCDSQKDIQIEFELYDEPSVFRILVHKTDEMNRALREVSFKIVDVNNEIVLDVYGKRCEGKTNENGELGFTLFADGEYYLVETSTNNGYILDTTKRKIEIDSDTELGRIDEEIEAMKIEIINYKERVPDTGDNSFRTSGVLSVASLFGLLVAVGSKKKYSE